MNFANGVSMNQAFIISIFSITVVFLVLLVISYVIDLVAFLIKKSGISNQTNAVSSALSGNNDEIVAVVTASIASALGTDCDKIAIKSLKEAPSSWGKQEKF